MKFIETDIWEKSRSWFTGNHCLRDAHAGDTVDAFLHAAKHLKLGEPIGHVTSFRAVPGESLEINVEVSEKIMDILKGEKKMNKNEILKDIDKIVITKDGDKKVLCRAYKDNRVAYTYNASCSPDDIFDFNIGAKLAVDRLYDGYDMTPKPKRKLFNGKILIQYKVEGNTYNRICTITKGFGSFTFQTKSGRGYVLNTNSLYEDSFEIGGDIVDLIKAFNESSTALAHNVQINCVLRIDD